MSMLDHIAGQRIAKGAAATLTATITDADGEVDTSVTSGVTVTISRLDGTALATAQSATATAGVCTYDLTAAQTAAGCDLLTATWTKSSVVRAVTYHEVVGRHWFAPSALLGIDGVERALAKGPGDSSTQRLRDARTWAEQLIEWATDVSWVPRVALDYFDGEGQCELILRHRRPRAVRAVTIDGTAQTVADYVVNENGTIEHLYDYPFIATQERGVSVLYDHGYDAPPEPLVRAALTAAAYHLFAERSSGVSPRATSFADGAGGTTQFARTDPDNPTGLPDVDAVIRSYSHRTPGIA